MKKTLLSGLAALCLFATSLASDFTTEITHMTRSDFGGYHGMQFALSPTYMSERIKNSGADLSPFTMGEEVKLNFIEFTTRYDDTQSQKYATDKSLKSTFVTLVDQNNHVIANSRATLTRVDKKGVKPALVCFRFDKQVPITIGLPYTLYFYEKVNGEKNPFRFEIFLTKDNQANDLWRLLIFNNNQYRDISSDYAPIVKIATYTDDALPTTDQIVATPTRRYLVIGILVGALLCIYLYFKKRNSDYYADYED